MIESCDVSGVRFRTVGDHCLVLRPVPLDTTPGGVQLVEKSKKPYHYGYCFAVGPDVRGVAAGDWVLLEPAMCREVFFDNPNKTMFTVVPESGVYMTLSSSVSKELGLLIPQLDVIDVLQRTRETGVPIAG